MLSANLKLTSHEHLSLFRSPEVSGTTVPDDTVRYDKVPILRLGLIDRTDGVSAG